MNLNDADRVELNELCSALVDGALSDDQFARLQALLGQSEEARRHYVRAMELSASLHSYASEMQSENAEPAKVLRFPTWRKWLAPLAAAAVVLLGIWVGRMLLQRESVTPDDSADLVARVTGGKDCQWAGPALSTGDELAAGQRVEIKTGFAELTFDSGAQLVLEGPATLQVRSAWEAELQRGRVKASVPQEAIGFRVVNAAVEVVDLGTEFSMTAGDGEAEVFVHQGAVEVHPRDAAGQRQPKLVLHEKQARRFARAGGGDVRDREAKFQKFAQRIAIQRLTKPFQSARWSFDEGAGHTAAATASGNPPKPFALEDTVRWAPGRFGTALAFDGAQTARAALTGPLRRGTRTVAFWTRIPDSAALSDAGVLAGVPMGRAWNSWCELSWNRTPDEGVLGALRVQAGTGYAIGSTPLRDGRWHHVAVVFGAPVKDRSPVKLYVDGRLETFSSKPLLRRTVDKAATEPEATLWLGGSPFTSERYRGMLDELIIVDQPLSPPEIRHLMRTNTLLSPEVWAQM